MRSRTFLLALLCLGALAVYAVFEFRTYFSAAQHAQNSSRSLQGELRLLTQADPRPTRESALLIAADIATLEARLSAAREALTGTSINGEARDVPVAATSKAEKHFAIARSVARLRQEATLHGVDLGASEEFGLSSKDPDQHAESIALDFRQCVHREYLLRTLFRSEPRRFLSLEAPKEALVNQPDLSAAPTGPTESEAAGHMVADVTSYRIAFLGQTASVREFLNGIATFELPFVVRSVEVEPSTAPLETDTEDRPRNRAVVPQTLSKFTVALDLIALRSEGPPH